MQRVLLETAPKNLKLTGDGQECVQFGWLQCPILKYRPWWFPPPPPVKFPRTSIGISVFIIVNVCYPFFPAVEQLLLCSSTFDLCVTIPPLVMLYSSRVRICKIYARSFLNDNLCSWLIRFLFNLHNLPQYDSPGFCANYCFYRYYDYVFSNEPFLIGRVVSNVDVIWSGNMSTCMKDI
jgi:hypothetical protein